MQPVSFAARTAAADKTTLHAKVMITKNANVVPAISRIFSLLFFFLLLLLGVINSNIICITILNYYRSSQYNTLYRNDILIIEETSADVR